MKNEKDDFLLGLIVFLVVYKLRLGASIGRFRFISVTMVCPKFSKEKSYSWLISLSHDGLSGVLCWRLDLISFSPDGL